MIWVVGYRNRLNVVITSKIMNVTVRIGEMEKSKFVGKSSILFFMQLSWFSNIAV